MAAPRQRRLLLSNAGTRGLGYIGPLLWSPDRRFMVFWYSLGEEKFRHVAGQATGEVAKLPLLTVGETIGGKP